MTKRVPGFQLCRAAALTGFAELLRARGQDPLRLAAEAGVPAAALSDPDLKIPASAVAWMLETATEHCALPESSRAIQDPSLKHGFPFLR